MRPTALSALCLPFAAAALLAQEPAPGKSAPTAKQKPRPTGRITGQVLCGDTRRPARGALVLLQPLGDKLAVAEAANVHSMARVGMDGSYVLEHVPPGTFAVVAILPGYLSPLDGLNASGLNTDSDAKLRKALAGHNSVTVRENSTATDDLVLERGAAVSGRVLYPDGSPASQVNLALEDVTARPDPHSSEPTMNVGGMMRTMFTHQSTDTDDQGHFRVSGIQPGTYRLSAMPAPEGSGADADMGMMVMMGMMNVPGLLRVYAGNTLHRKEAKTFELRGGDEVADIQITLPIDSFHAVAGHLTAKDGRPLSLATLTLTDSADDTLRFQTTLGDNGTFRFPSVPPGTYLLAATEGKIVTPNAKMPAILALREGTPTAAFAEGSTAVLVKDSDVTDIAVTVDEVPLETSHRPADQPDSPDA